MAESSPLSFEINLLRNHAITATEDSHRETWWSRPSGGREVLRVAMPMVASTMSWTLMSFVDAAILFRVSGTAMSAAFSASLTWFALMSLLWGICSYTSTFVSQYHGDGQPEKIGQVIWQGVWLAVWFMPIALACRSLAPALFAWHDAPLADLEIRFFQILCWGAAGMLAAQSLEAFYSGRGRTWVVMCVDCSAVLVNLVLDGVWVLGWGGGESWGMEGAAWATVVAQGYRAVTYAALVLRAHNRQQFHTWRGIRWDVPLLGRLLKFGGPSGVQMMLEIMGFTIFVQLVGRLGLVETEATSMAFRVSHVAFMPVWGFGMATAVLVGQRLGENRPDLAARVAGTSLVVTLGYMGFISLLFVLLPGLFLQIFFTHDTASTPNAVRDLAVELLRFVAAYNLFDAVVIIFVSVLRGAGDTRFVMGVSSLMATLLAVASWLAVEHLGIGVYGCWTLITVWIWSLALIHFTRFCQGRWRSMRVIEQVHLPEANERLCEEAP